VCERERERETEIEIEEIELSVNSFIPRTEIKLNQLNLT
jgi:hypothetical protein